MRVEMDIYNIYIYIYILQIHVPFGHIIGDLHAAGWLLEVLRKIGVVCAASDLVAISW